MVQAQRLRSARVLFAVAREGMTAIERARFRVSTFALRFQMAVLLTRDSKLETRNLHTLATRARAGPPDFLLSANAVDQARRIQPDEINEAARLTQTSA